MFLYASSPWLCHQSLLHPVVGRSAVGNMPVRGLKPHVLGELDLRICFNLSTFDILNWKATEISSFSLRLEFCVILQHFLLKPLGHAFQIRGVGMFMAQIRFVACLIILALSAGAADQPELQTNRTDIGDMSQGDTGTTNLLGGCKCTRFNTCNGNCG